MTADQVLGDVEQLSGEPDGRFVAVTLGGWRRAPLGDTGQDGAIASYVPDALDGSLGQVSYAQLFPRPQGGAVCGSCEEVGSWSWLSTRPDRAFAVWGQTWGTLGRHSRYSYVSLPVAGDGQLGGAFSRAFPEDEEWGEFALDARRGMIYKRGSIGSPSNPFPMGGLTAHAVEPDGGLTQMGWSDLCVASRIEPTPMVGARGLLFARGWVDGTCTTCSWIGARLAPHSNLGFCASTAGVFDPIDSSAPAFVAFPGGIAAHDSEPAHRGIHLFALGSDGGLELRDTVVIPDAVTQVVFHPQGRFLFTNPGASLQTYAVGSDGHLTLIETIDGAGGQMAVTIPR